MGDRFRPYLMKNYSSFVFYLFNLVIVIYGPYYLAIMGVCAFGFLFYPQWKAKFDLFYAETEENKSRIEKCPSIKSVTLFIIGKIYSYFYLKRHFYPTIWLGYGSLQAFFGNKSKYASQNMSFKREIIIVPKDGHIALGD